MEEAFNVFDFAIIFNVLAAVAVIFFLCACPSALVSCSLSIYTRHISASSQAFALS